MLPSEQNQTLRTAPPETQVQENGLYVISGNLFGEPGASTISVWGTSSQDISAYKPGETADMGEDGALTVLENGDYRLVKSEEFSGRRGERVFVTATTPPEFTLENYRNMLFDPDNREGMTKAFFNLLTYSFGFSSLMGFG